MIIAPNKVDAYLNAKGIKPRMTDAEWSNAIGVLIKFLKDGRGFRVKLLHQQEDALRWFSCNFPNSVPQPYRFLDYIEFGTGDSLTEQRVVSELRKLRIPFHLKTKKNGSDDDDLVSLLYVGPTR